MVEIVEGRVAHATPGRLRVTAPAKRYDRAFFETLRERLSRSEPVTGVAVNPAAASVVIYSPDPQAALETLEREGLLRVAAPASTMAALRQREVPAPRYAAVDAQIRQWSGGRVGARGVSAALIVVVSLAVKLARGNAMSAAVFVLLYAGGVAQRRFLASARSPRRERPEGAGEAVA